MTTTVDFDALELSQGPRVLLMQNQEAAGDGTGTAYTDFSDFSAVHVECECRLTHTTVGPSRCAITVEHSDDGNSWTTATTFSYGPDGKQSAKIESPKAQWRAKYSTSGGSIWRVVAVTVAPAYLDALPEGWVTDAFETNTLKIQNDDGSFAWIGATTGIAAWVAPGNDPIQLGRVGDTNYIFEVENDGTIGLGPMPDDNGDAQVRIGGSKSDQGLIDLLIYDQCDQETSGQRGTLMIEAIGRPDATPNVAACATFQLDNSGNGKVGFFGASPTGKATTPITLGDVITILQNLGFCS